MRKQEMSYDDFFRSQKRIVYEYLKNNIATGAMIEQATGVHHKCICWIKFILEDQGRLWEVRKGKCKVTGRMAWYLTTNPEFKPEDNQTNLFE